MIDLTYTSFRTILICGCVHFYLDTNDISQCIIFVALLATSFAIYLPDAFQSNHRPKYLKHFTYLKLYSPPNMAYSGVLCFLLGLNTITSVLLSLISRPSYLQNSANLVNTLSSTAIEGAITMASSANSNNHNYVDSRDTRPLICLPLLDSLNLSSTYLCILSKYTANKSGEHGQPYFSPSKMLISSMLSPFSSYILALKFTYNIFSDLMTCSSKPNS